MIKEFRLPDLGENITGGDIVGLKVSKGDTVKVDQVILEIETDKATIEVPANVAGTVKSLDVKEGSSAEIGQLILTIETGAAETAAAPATPPKPAPEAPKPAEPRQAAQAPAPATKPPAAPKPAPTVGPPAHQPKPAKIAPAAPSVRRFAREIGIDIYKVPGTGPGGRISREDVKLYSRDKNRIADQKTGTGGLALAQIAQDLPDFSVWGDVEREKMNNIRRSSAAAMTKSWTLIPHVTQHDKANITDLERLRKNFGAQAASRGVKLTITAILLKVVTAALRKFPKFNASIDLETNELIYKKYYNIGVAADTEHGLLVPVIKETEQKNILDMAVELHELAEKARMKKLAIPEMQGATFTITNLGGIGGSYFTPIVNWPQAAILGVSRGQQEPVYTENQFVPQLMLPLSLSYDHRIVDGADAARFLRWICTALEQPFMIAFEG